MTTPSLRTDLLLAGWVGFERVDGCWVTASRPIHEAPVWGELGYSFVNGVPHLLWSGDGMFQLQISYDLINWFDEGECRKGPADIAVTPRDNGGPQYFRVVACHVKAPETE